MQRSCAQKLAWGPTRDRCRAAPDAQRLTYKCMLSAARSLRLRPTAGSQEGGSDIWPCKGRPSHYGRVAARTR
eukprot:9246757-Alexandrium_andersonii.AAC.1